MFRKISGARAETLAGMALGAPRLGATGRTWGIRPDWEHQSEHRAPGRIGDQAEFKAPGRILHHRAGLGALGRTQRVHWTRPGYI
jgi:hypothetical protein